MACSNTPIDQNIVLDETEASKAASLMGKRGYTARVERFGIERIQEISRENGKLVVPEGNREGSVGKAEDGKEGL